MTVAQMRIQANLNEQIDARLETGFNKRAIQLAKIHHLDGTPRLLELRKATILLVIPSRNRSTTYKVVADIGIGVRSCWCECKAAAHNLPCSHVGAALLYLRQMHRASHEYAEY